MPFPITCTRMGQEGHLELMALLFLRVRASFLITGHANKEWILNLVSAPDYSSPIVSRPWMPLRVMMWYEVRSSLNP